MGDIGKPYSGLSGKSASDFGEGAQYITYKSIFDNARVDISRNEYVKITNKEREIGSQNQVKRGDVFFTISSETPEEVGMSSVLLDDINDCYLNSFCFGYRLTTPRVRPEFLRFYLRSNKIRKQISILAQGSTRFNISKNEIMRIPMMAPSVVEQNKLAVFLELIEERIAIQNKTIEDLKKLKAALEEKIFASVQGHLTPLSEILVERVEKSSTNNQYEILSSTISGIYSQREYFNKDIASSDNTGYKVIHKSDIVLSPQNLWMGNINFNDKFDIGIVSPSYKVFSIRPEFDSRYVALLLKTKRALWNYMLVSEQGASVVRRNLNIESFWGISFKIPSRDTQKRIGQGIRCIELKIEREMEYLAGLQKQKTFLLNNLFV